MIRTLAPSSTNISHNLRIRILYVYILPVHVARNVKCDSLLPTLFCDENVQQYNIMNHETVFQHGWQDLIADPTSLYLWSSLTISDKLYPVSAQEAKRKVHKIIHCVVIIRHSSSFPGISHRETLNSKPKQALSHKSFPFGTVISVNIEVNYACYWEL